MIDAKRLTTLVVVAGVVLWCLYDLVVYSVAGNDATISHLFLGTYAWMGIAFAFGVVFTIGVLIGHFFLPQRVANIVRRFIRIK